jgi:hypothetical protein
VTSGKLKHKTSSPDMLRFGQPTQYHTALELSYSNNIVQQ